MPLGPKHNPSLGCQTLVPRVLAHKPCRLGTLVPHHGTLSALQKETLIYIAEQNPRLGEPCMDPDVIPILGGLLWTLMPI